MKSPKNMRIIQIEITNACDKRCSNCTRLCGHHKKPYFMNFDTFKRAVDSLDGYQGVRSIMGGEPTLHPEYERFLRYLSSKFPLKSVNALIYPQKNFIEAIHKVELKNSVLISSNGIERIGVIGAGLYSNIGNNYKKYYEIINDTASFQCLNDHVNPVYHQPALISRKDMGIPDEEWHKLRDACWMQNEWSASITPKGAFFCEIAAALDILFDGPGGWLIEPDWWQREPRDFGEQLRWCELCGFALNTFTRDSAEEIDDVSPAIYEMLKSINSPKLKSERVNLVKIENGKIAEESKRENKRFSAVMPYIEHYEDRFSAINSVLFADKYDFISIPEGKEFGKELNKILTTSNEWLVIKTPNAEIPNDFCEKMSKYVLNPGTLHCFDFGFMFNKRAISLREFGFDRIAQTQSFAEIVNMWQPNKVIKLSYEMDEADKMFYTLKKGVKYAVWGTGAVGNRIVDFIRGSNAELAFVIDSDSSKHGKDFYGAAIQPPEFLKSHLNYFDFLIIANIMHFKEIKQNALKIGVPDDKILLINQI